MSKKFRCALAACVLAIVAALAVAFPACTLKSNHPRAKITVEFNEVSYEIEYTLYRNMYPQTVQHFIELADAGYYDNMIVHNYNRTSDWFTGAYGYNISSEDTTTYDVAYSGGSSAIVEYLNANSKEQAYYDLVAQGVLTPTVYKNTGYDANGNEVPEDPMASLIGEFAANNHIIENNALTAKTGALKMFYYEKENPNKKVTIVTGNGQTLTHDYQYNCATSVFAMQVGANSSYAEDKYCVFGELRNDKALDSLNELLDAISDYIDDAGYTTSTFATSVSVDVDELDTYSTTKSEASFSVPRTPIIIKTVKITKH